MLKKVPQVWQDTLYTCSAACVDMIRRYYETDIPLPRPNIHGLNPETLVNHFEKHGWAYNLSSVLPPITPFISLIYLGDDGHFVVTTKVTQRSVYYNDPLYGPKRVNRKDFKSVWNLICYPLPPRHY